MTFAVSTFQSPNGKVRKAAVNLILEVYKKAGNIVRTYLRNQKPALVNVCRPTWQRHWIVLLEPWGEYGENAPILVEPFQLNGGIDG